MPDILPALGHGVSCLTIVGIDAAAALLAGFGGVFGKGEHVTVAFGTTSLNFLFGVTVLLFLVTLPFLTLGLSQEGAAYIDWPVLGLLVPSYFSLLGKFSSF